jgi:hypothetical protein
MHVGYLTLEQTVSELQLQEKWPDLTARSALPVTQAAKWEPSSKNKYIRTPNLKGFICTRGSLYRVPMACYTKETAPGPIASSCATASHTQQAVFSCGHFDSWAGLLGVRSSSSSGLCCHNQVPKAEEHPLSIAQ